MQRNIKPPSLRTAKYYIFKALKFYDLKNEKITPVIFLVILFAGLIGASFPETSGEGGSIYLVFNAILMIILNIGSTIYLHACIRETKGEEASLKGSANLILKKLPIIILAFLLLFVIVLAGTFLLVVPGLIFYYTFLFNVCYIIDKDLGVKDGFSASKTITTGRKLEIFAIFVLFDFLTFIPLLIIMYNAITSGNSLIMSFILTFFSSIITLMKQRLTAMIYVDLQYGQKKL